MRIFATANEVGSGRPRGAFVVETVNARRKYNEPLIVFHRVPTPFMDCVSETPPDFGNSRRRNTKNG